jgi:predicted enzyme related to lactoylglutathione lyase
MPDGHDGCATFYVDVDDVEATLSRAEPRRQPLMGPEAVMEGLTIGLFADPEGHVVGVAAQG